MTCTNIAWPGVLERGGSWTLAVETNVLTAHAMAENLLLAPGSLFSPSQLPSNRMHLNLAAMQDRPCGASWSGSCRS